MKAGRKPFCGFLLAFVLAAAALPSCKAAALPALGADLSQTSVSGLSSGGYMAGQFHVAFSKIVIGVAIVAAGPFGCAQSAVAQAIPYFPAALASNLAQAENGCMADRLSAFGVLDGKKLFELASSLAADDKIDPVAGLKQSKVYLYSGSDDRTVVTPVVEAARDFYVATGVPAENIDFVLKKPGGHAFLTADAGGACERSDPPYVNNCRYDQAEAILRRIYGPLAPKGSARPESFLTFEQGRYAMPAATLADEGVLYVPQACRTGAHCRTHVVFHGCKQSRAEVGDAFIHGSGFADWAEPNKIIVLFPQIATSPLNPSACWDWWGYTGLDYLTKDAPQIKAVATMLMRLAQDQDRAN